MNITNWIVLFIVFWFTLYGVVYYYFMTMPGASLSFDGNSIESFVSNIHNTVDKSSPHMFEQHGSSGVDFDPHENQFLSNSCKLTNSNLKQPPKDSISVVIPVRNEDPGILLRTLKSLLQNSNQELRSIVLVDVYSKVQLSSSVDITGLSKIIHIVRSNRLVGLAGARHMGAKFVIDGYSSVFSRAIPSDHMLVFMSSHGVVSKDWLVSLYNTVNPEATPGYGLASATGKANIIATPTIDIWDKNSGDLIPSDDNIVPGFTWGLGFRWESLVNKDKHASERIVSSYTGSSEIHSGYKDQAKVAPVASGVLGITINFYNEIGGFDTSLDTVPTDKTIADSTDFPVDRGGNDESVGIHTYYWSNDDIADMTIVEFSLRVWMCGGANTAIIQQPCSRVANAYSSVHEEGLPVGGSDGGGVTQRIVDHCVMRIADYWFRPVSYRDVIYQARFIDRLAYTITDITAQLRSPELLYKLPNFAAEQCLSIEWYLKEIYPGLLQEVDIVKQKFADQYSRRKELIEKAYKPLIEQYHKETVLTNINAGEVDEMKQYAIMDRKLGKLGMTVGRGATLEKVEVKIPVALTDKEKEKISHDSHENHVIMVRDEGVCIDQPTTWDRDDCAIRASHGECDSNPSYMMFGCPKSCGFCDEKTGELCTDFYLKKCPIWRDEGLCSENAAQMDVECRRSCGLCKRKGDPAVPTANSPLVHHGKDPVAAAPPVNVVRTDPYVAQRQYHDGLLPDPISLHTGASTRAMCQMSGKPNGQLLDRVHVASIDKSSNAPKIFCGIYTMESKHRDNVQATRETWAKKCTGFVAFSTADDPTIPGMLFTIFSLIFYPSANQTF